MPKEVSVTEKMTKKISKKTSIDESTNVLEEKDDLTGCPGAELEGSKESLQNRSREIQPPRL